MSASAATTASPAKARIKPLKWMIGFTRLKTAAVSRASANWRGQPPRFRFRCSEKEAANPGLLFEGFDAPAAATLSCAGEGARPLVVPGPLAPTGAIPTPI